MGYAKHAEERSDALVRRYDTRDPFAIAKALGIVVFFSPSLHGIKGLYRVIKRNRFIILNAENNETVNRIVCAHELGHDQLHRELASSHLLQERMLYDLSTAQEYEANLFAANLLLEDELLLSLARQGFTARQIASELDTDENLVALKTDVLIAKGHPLQPQRHDSSFLQS